MDGTRTAEQDLGYIRSVMERTRRRIDPHSFHFVHWGAIVLVWYPLANLAELTGHREGLLPLGIAALALGSLLSFLRESRLARHPRLAGEDTFIGDQVGIIVAGCLAGAGILSFAGPATGFVEGQRVPVIWGLAYAVMAFMVGVVYSREYLRAGIAIFVGALAAMALPEYAGLVLGPFMGLGMIVPGVMAERRVRQMAAEGEPADGSVAP